MTTYIGHVSIVYMRHVIGDDSEWATEKLEVNYVLCKIDDEYGIVRLTDNYLEWEENSPHLIGNTKVIINETISERVDDLVEGILYSDDLIEATLLEKKWWVERV